MLRVFETRAVKLVNKYNKTNKNRGHDSMFRPLKGHHQTASLKDQSAKLNSKEHAYRTCALTWITLFHTSSFPRRVSKSY